MYLDGRVWIYVYNTYISYSIFYLLIVSVFFGLWLWTVDGDLIVLVYIFQVACLVVSMDYIRVTEKQHPQLWQGPSGELSKATFLSISILFCFVFGLTSLLNIWGHIEKVPACSSGTLTNVLPHRNAMLQTQDTTPHPVTVCRLGVDLSLCYPLCYPLWNVTLECTATHFICLGSDPTGKSFPDLPHTPANAQLYDAVLVVASGKLSRKNRSNQVLNRGLFSESITLSARPQLLPQYLYNCF